MKNNKFNGVNRFIGAVIAIIAVIVEFFVLYPLFANSKNIMAIRIILLAIVVCSGMSIFLWLTEKQLTKNDKLRRNIYWLKIIQEIVAMCVIGTIVNIATGANTEHNNSCGLWILLGFGFVAYLVSAYAVYDYERSLNNSKN